MFIGLWNAEDGVLIAIERDRTAMLQEVALQGFEITERVLGCRKPQLHQGAGRVIDEDEQGAGRRTIFKPAVI